MKKAASFFIRLFFGCLLAAAYLSFMLMFIMNTSAWEMASTICSIIIWLLLISLLSLALWIGLSILCEIGV